MIYYFDDFELDVDRGTLRKAGVELPLRPKSFDVLLYLLRHAGQLVSRDDLLDTVWADVVVTPDSVNQCLIEIRKQLSDESRRVIRTVPRKGVILDVPVRVGGDSSDGAGRISSIYPNQGDSRRSVFPWLPASAIMLVILAVGYLLVQDRTGSPENAAVESQADPDYARSIVVLPFNDLSAPGDQGYLANGIAEQLLTQLSRVPALRVISRTSAFAFEGRNLTVAEIADALNVSHVLEGSVQVAGDELRVTAQLIDARQDAHVWSRVFERRLADVFAIQDEIAELVVRQLEVSLLDQLPRVQRTDPEAYRLFLMSDLTDVAEENVAASIDDLEQAVSIDPGYAPAWARLGRRYFYYFLNYEASEAYFDKASRSAERSIQEDPYHAPAHAVLGELATYRNDLQTAAQHFERALELDPADPDIATSSIFLLEGLGRFDEAIRLAESAVRRDPLSVNALANLALIYTMARRTQEAEPQWRKVLDASPDGAEWFSIFFAFVLVENDKLGEAGAVISALRDDDTRLLGMTWLYHRLGMVEEFQAGKEKLLAQAPLMDLIVEIRVNVLLGEFDRAFELLATVTDFTHWARERYWPMYWSIQDDPRWEEFLVRAGVSDEQQRSIQFKLPEHQNLGRQP